MLSDLLSIKFTHKDNERFFKNILTTLAFTVIFIKYSSSYTNKPILISWKLTC